MYSEPKVVSETNFEELLEKFQTHESFPSTNYVYFWGDKQAISDEDLPSNIHKLEVYENSSISYDQFLDQLPKDENNNVIYPEICVFYSPSGFHTFMTHFEALAKSNETHEHSFSKF